MRQFTLCLALLALFACDSEDTKRADTQITLRVDAESALQGKLDSLRATLFINANGVWTQRSSVSVPVARLHWPLDIPVLAKPQDESAQIEVIVEAYSGTSRLAQTRVVTFFSKDVMALVKTQLFSCPGHADGFVCAADTCHGAGCAICSNTGDCIAVVPVQGDTDAGELASQRDAAQAVSDAGVRDANTQASGDDASMAVSEDAGVTPTPDAATSSCADNACTAPYVCITTPAGYTCRGQFADWPMPDSTPGAKVAPSYTATPEIITDNVTKLQWQLGVPRIYPGCTEYTQYTDGTKDDPGTECTRPQAKAYCDNLNYAGSQDWRLPTIIELASLIDTTKDSGIGIDPVFLDNEFYAYVSDSTYAGSPSQIWGANYGYRWTYYDAPNASKVRCVRGGAVPSFARPSDRYKIDGDEVTDQATGLIWQRSFKAMKYMSATADDAGLPVLTAGACAAPWRMPTGKELLTLVDYTRSKPAINIDVFPNTPNEDFWAAPNLSGSTVNFSDGSLGTYDDTGYVRCVR
jgi:hypothetical protein